MSSATQVYTGPWINHARGWIIGATITLDSRDGGLLTSFLAAFITVVASQLWNIISFTVHQLRSSRSSQDGLHHQHQIVFRNEGSPANAAKTFISQAWAWRGRTKRPVLRSIPWILLTICYVIVFALLSVFSGEVTKSAGNDRLIVPGNCGYWRLDDDLNTDTSEAQVWKTLNDSITAATYSRQCYGGNTDPLQCGTFIQPSLPSTSDANASCPFQSGMCIWSDTAAFSVDTGLIDSRRDLGINAPEDETINFRKVTTCAPIVPGDYLTYRNSTVTPGSLNMTYDFGPILGSTNYTYYYNTVGVITIQPYSISVVEALAGFSGDTWIPVEALNRTDADVTLIFIAPNSVYYSTPNDDPIFGATVVQDSFVIDGINYTYYTSDNYVSIMGCAEQYQYCDVNTGDCTEMGGSSQSYSRAMEGNITFNIGQKGAIERIGEIINSLSFYDIINPRGVSALRAQETLSNLEQAALPNNEWQLEIQSWSDTSLARLQRGVLEYVTGPQDVLPGSYVWVPSDPISERMCHTQLVRGDTGGNKSTISFSVLGVAIILVVGTFIILTSLIIEALVALLQHHVFKNSRYRNLNWILDDKFQLQRMMYEAVDMGGTWSGTKSSVPVTEKGVVFGGWDDIDVEHPSVVLNWREKKAEAVDEEEETTITTTTGAEQTGKTGGRGTDADVDVDVEEVDLEDQQQHERANLMDRIRSR